MTKVVIAVVLRSQRMKNTKILTVDVGTGTQDIFLNDSNLELEHGFKLVLPSPTMMVRQAVKRALQAQSPIVLTGHLMGGGPSAWAIEERARGDSRYT